MRGDRFGEIPWRERARGGTFKYAQVHQTGAWTVQQLQLVVGSTARYIRPEYAAFGGCGGRIRSIAVRPSCETGAVG